MNTTSNTTHKTTIDPADVENFSRIAHEWWDENGPFKPLHDLNPTRLSHLKTQICAHFDRNHDDAAPFKGLSILDVGCGGGLICEPMKRMGAQVTGLDASDENIAVATPHAIEMGLEIDYQAKPVEELSQSLTKDTQKYDVVLALEIIEHVADPILFIEHCLKCLKKDGIIIFSTLNRTAKSYAMGIVAAEYILRWVPRGTHQWKQFIKPSELVRMLTPYDAHAHDITGLIYNPFKREFSLSKSDLDVNYFLSATFKK